VIALGLALVLIVAAATVFAVVASATTSPAIELTAFNVTISPTPLALFIAGALSVAFLGLGFILITRGTRRKARTHRELKELRKENAIAATRAAAEREEASAADRQAATSADNTAEHTSAEDTTKSASADKGPEGDTGKSATDPSGQGPTS